MGQQIIKQPNGLFAVWSSVVDDFTMVDATAEEIIDDWSDAERKRIADKVRNTIAALEAGEKPYYQFTKSFEECVVEIRERHGNDAESLRLLDAPA